MPGLHANVEPPVTIGRGRKPRYRPGGAGRRDIDEGLRRELRADPRMRVGNMAASPAWGWAATLLCAAAVATVMAAVVMAMR